MREDYVNPKYNRAFAYLKIHGTKLRSSLRELPFTLNPLNIIMIHKGIFLPCKKMYIVSNISRNLGEHYQHILARKNSEHIKKGPRNSVRI